MRNFKAEVKIVSGLEKKYVVEREKTLTLTIKLNAETPVIFRWFRNGVFIDEKINSRTKITSKNGVYELRIERIDSQVDHGVYTFAFKEPVTGKTVSSTADVLVKGLCKSLLIA